jgi:flagellin
MVGTNPKIKEDLIMALRINTNVAALNAHAQLIKTESALNSSMSKLSSGYRISTAGDDASGLAVANGLRSRVRSLEAAAQNTVSAKAGLAIADGTANQIELILERLTTICTSGGAEATAEMTQLRAEIDRIAGSTPASGGTIQVGTDATSVSQITVTIGAMTCAGLGLTATTAEPASIANIQVAQGALNTIVGNIGAGMNRLEFAYNNLQTQIVNVSAQESAIRDVDMASEMVNFTKSQIMLQAGTAMLAQANMSSQSILSLFQ